MFGWLPGKRAPERVPTDTVVPLHWLDDTKTNRCLILYFMMRFDDVLDVEKLIGALEKLLEKPGWRKLGARLRLNPNGKLEYHIPEKYTPQRRAFAFSHVDESSMSIHQHPLASQIPRPNGRAQVSSAVEKLRPLLGGPDLPSRIEDYYYSDRPQLGVHVTSFADATLVTLSWMHTFLDSMSQATIIDAWTAVLEGRDEDVPEFFGEKRDPLGTLGARLDLDDEKEEEYVLKEKAMSNGKMLKFVFNVAWEQTVYRAEETRAIVIPPKLFQKIKTQAFKDLQSVDWSTLVLDRRDPDNPEPFLSDGDILCAWVHRLFTGCQPWAASAPPSRIIHIMNVFNMSDLLRTTEPKLIPAGTVHIGNCTTAISSLFRIDDFLSQPLGVVAAKIRSDLVAQSTRPQVNANMRITKSTVTSTGHPPLFGEGDMVLSAFTNWTKGNFFEVDFKAAVKKAGDVEHRVGRPTGLSATGGTVMLTVRNAAPCLGKDAEGNWWCGAVLRPETWNNVERKLDELNREL
ncbi:lysR family regulatory protein [Massarina eburnea CBS 473.64]|uniref:LysR family regulatory protein n=1 Tax=Massarina eburnea CBS 473.64 TaxID=1395130 RepID=A0A6A6S1M6_9PLEO|nr:lysR family regulatory protein [Massarina eburnea CBS 473.64]